VSIWHPDRNSLNTNLTALDDYRYSVTTNLGAVTPDLNQQVTVVQMPSEYILLITQHQS
jgi:hypothetical protein